MKFSCLRKANADRQREWDAGEQLDLSYLGNALAGEVGEACNVIKKLERQRLGLRGSRSDRAELANELADVIIYADLIAQHIGVDLGIAVARKFNATSTKYNLLTRISNVPEV